MWLVHSFDCIELKTLTDAALHSNIECLHASCRQNQDAMLVFKHTK